MNKTYIFLGALMVIVAASLLLLPERTDTEEIPPEELLAEINDPSRYLSTDQVAEMIISGDPSLLLLDCRDSMQYNDYHLPGAFHVPPGTVTDSLSRLILSQEGRVKVFYSNDDITAEQIWVVSRRMGMDDIYVMKDGLNRWMETIIRPEAPPETAASEVFDLYQFRLGASMYFGGGNMPVVPEQDVAEPVIFQRKEKKSAAEGGC